VRVTPPTAQPVASPAVMASERPIEAVVFDMDGILLDSEPIWRAVEREVFAGVGIDVTDDDLMETMGVRIADVVERWHRRQPWADPSREQVVDAIVEGVAEAIPREGVLNEEAARAVDYVRGLGLRVALASSSPIRLIRAVLSLGGLADRFDAVLSAEDEERGKPDPAVYLSAARALGVAPEPCLALEDSINGVRSAKAAGMVCVAVPASPGDVEGFGDADLVLGSLAEFDDRIWASTGTVPAAAAPGDEQGLASGTMRRRSR
jgi:HAD superfamily hydrolase (TIGR01509 family)